MNRYLLLVCIGVCAFLAGCGRVENVSDVENSDFVSQAAESAAANAEEGTAENMTTEVNAEDEMGETVGSLKISDELLLDFEKYVIAKTAENSELYPWTVEEEDMALERIYYGSFSKEDAKEVFVLLKFLDLPHVAGLDRTVGLIFDQDTMELVAYKEFAADEVEIGCFDMKNGKSRILFIGRAMSTGIASQKVRLYEVQGSEWLEYSMDDILDGFGGWCEYFCYMGENMMVVTSMKQLTSPSEVKGILVWNVEEGQFEVAHSWVTYGQND